MLSSLRALPYLAVLISSAAWADPQPTTRNLYVGLTAGYSAVSVRDAKLADDQPSLSAGSVGIWAGMPLGTAWPLAVEVGHQRIAKQSIRYSTGGTFTDLPSQGHATYLALKADLPLSERWALFVRAGVSRNQAEGETPAEQPQLAVKGSATGALFGAGVQWRVMPELTLRAEFTSFGKASAGTRADGASLGAMWHF